MGMEGKGEMGEETIKEEVLMPSNIRLSAACEYLI